MQLCYYVSYAYEFKFTQVFQVVLFVLPMLFTPTHYT